MMLKMVNEVKSEGKTYREYELGLYEVEETIFESGYSIVRISKDFRIESTRAYWFAEYLPEIFERGNEGFGSSSPHFVISTTSYGALKPEEIKKVIAGYNYAMEAVEILNREFGNK